MTYEDFENDYTEVDTNSKLDAHTTKIEWGLASGAATGFKRSDNGYFWKDHGLDHFGDFDILMDYEFEGGTIVIEAGDADWRVIHHGFLVLCNNVSPLPDNSIHFLPRQRGAFDNDGHIAISERQSGASKGIVVGTVSILPRTTYYARIKRITGALFSIAYYAVYGNATDRANEENAIDAIQKTLSDLGSTPLRYLMAVVGPNSAVDPDDHSSGWLDNVDLQEVVVAIPRVVGNGLTCAVFKK